MAERKLLVGYGTVGLASWVGTSLVSSTLFTSVFTATIVLLFHETVKHRFRQLVDVLSSNNSGIAHFIDDGSFMNIIIVAIIDLLIAVPMLAPEPYAWHYTQALIFHFLIMILMVALARWQYELISTQYEKIRQQANSSYGGLFAVLVTLSLYRISLVPEMSVSKLLFQNDFILMQDSITLSIAVAVVLIALLVAIFLVWFASGVIGILALSLLVPILIVYAPEHVWQGIATAPLEVRIWGAVAAIVSVVVSFLPSFLKMQNSDDSHTDS